MSQSAQSTESLFEIYERRRTELLEVARRQQKIIDELALDDAQPEGSKPGALLAELVKRLESERLRVLVIGRFSAGKSTFINALLGQRVLPATPLPTTGVLCEIRYVPESQRKGRLFPKPGMGPDGSSEPFDVAIADLEKELGQYVKIAHRQGSEPISRYDKFELYWPIELCRHGVDLIDTVGLDDPDSRDRITIEQAATADTILYCMKSQDAYSAKDKQVIGYLHSLGYRSILFAITNWDFVKDAAARGEIPEEEFAALQRQNLAEWTDLKGDGVVFVDSLAALTGRIHGDPVKVRTSGITALEERLEQFLTEEKGRAKLFTALRSLRASNHSSRAAIPTRINLWRAEVTELERRYKEAELPLQTLESQRRLLVTKAEMAIRDIGREARDLAGRHLLELPDRIKTWVELAELEKIAFPPFKSNVQPVVESLVRELQEQIEEDLARWGQNVLTPVVTTRLQELEQSLEEGARAFIEKIDEIRVRVAVGVDPASVRQQEVSMLGRVLAGTYSVVTGDILTGGLGVFLGAKAMFTTMAIQFGAGLVLFIVGLVNPVALVAATIGSILTGTWINLGALKRGIKSKVGAALSENVVTNRLDLASAIEQRVTERLATVPRALDEGLAGEVASVRGEVETVLAAKQRGQADADVEIGKLRALEAANIAVEEQIYDLIFEAGIKL